VRTLPRGVLREGALERPRDSLYQQCFDRGLLDTFPGEKANVPIGSSSPVAIRGVSGHQSFGGTGRERADNSEV